jgi:mannose-1-phosphate guanylyltransferase
MTFDNSVYAVILAGGSGTRFWPKSRQKHPKQLCKLGGADSTMLEITLARLDGVIPPNRRIIVTHVDQLVETRCVTAGLCETIIAEPEARNTANALALAALEIESIERNKSVGLTHQSNPAIMISLHADHVISDVSGFLATLELAVSSAKQGYLTLIGIKPRYAETGFGYIEKDCETLSKGVHRVKSFHEKPSKVVAEKFLESPHYLWNAGLFTFPVSIFLKELDHQIPDSMQTLRSFFAIQKKKPSLVECQDLAPVYASLQKISVDHAVLEKSKNVTVVSADIGWQDVGSWDALSQCFKTDSNNNFVSGDVLTIDTSGCTIDTDGPLVATVGLQDMVVVHANGAILVCPKSRAQDVKLIVDRLKEQRRQNLL